MLEGALNPGVGEPETVPSVGETHRQVGVG